MTSPKDAALVRVLMHLVVLGAFWHKEEDP